jgi:hypothetical protein
MTITFKGYHDSALTQEITSGNPLTATHVVGATDPADRIVYFGSTASGKKLQAASSPGTDPVVVSVDDSASGSGAPATEFKLALSSGGLAGATPGASLNLSATILSGVGNAVPIYTRRTSAVGTSGAYTDISLKTNAVVEAPV